MPLKIKSISSINEQISIIFEENWYQEDIEYLRQLLLDKLTNYKMKEVTLGADRENIRFEYLSAEFVLNFDFYSQSCWFSAQDELSSLKIHHLYKVLLEG